MNSEKLILEIKYLTSSEIDELFFRCGWIDADRNTNKSLPDWRINQIKEGKL